MNKSYPLVILAALAVLACEDSGAVFVEHLAIVNINPSHGAVQIGYDTSVTVTFSEVLLPQTVTATTLCLTDDATPIADPSNPCAGAVLAAVTYDAATLTSTVDPGADLLPDRRYTLHITNGIEGSESGSLPATVTASFRTIPTL